MTFAGPASGVYLARAVLSAVEILSEWKVNEAKYHRRGERYYRKHYRRVRTDNAEVMILNAVRHVKSGENPNNRCRLYTIEADAART